MSTKQLKSAKPEIIVAMFVSRTGRCDNILMSTIGELERSSTIAQRRKNSAATTKPEQARRRPTPRFASVSATSSDRSRRRAAARRDVDARRGPDRRLGHEPVHEREREGDRNRAEQEEQPPGEVVDDHAREPSEAAADPEDGRDQGRSRP